MSHGSSNSRNPGSLRCFDLVNFTEPLDYINIEKDLK